MSSPAASAATGKQRKERGKEREERQPRNDVCVYGYCCDDDDEDGDEGCCSEKGGRDGDVRRHLCSSSRTRLRLPCINTPSL